MNSSAALLAALALTSAGCAQSIHYDTFGIAAPDNQPARIEAALARLAAAPPARDHAVAYGVGGSPSELFVVDLETGNQLWSQAADPRSWPHLAGDVIVSHEGERIIGRDVRTGAQRFSFSDGGMWLVGAAGEGHLGAFTLSSSPGAGAHSQLVIVRGAEIAHRMSATHAMGSPEVAGGMVLVPWGSQYLSFLDPTTTEEVARVRVRGTVLGHAFAKGGHVYVGQRDLFRLTPTIASGTAAEAAHYAPPRVDLPGRPGFMLDPYQAPPTTGSAVHRVRLAFRPSGTGEDVRLTDDTLYALFHRVVFALDAATGAVRWAYESPQDLAGAEPVPGGLLLADVSGGITTLDAHDGAVRRQLEGHHAATLVRFHALRLDLSDAGAANVPVAEQLAAIVTDADTRMAPASVFALRALASLPGDGPTTSLLAICESTTATRSVREEACAALSDRSEGRSAIVAALGQHGDFVSGTAVPAVGPLAQAAAGMEATEAVPLLLRHLADPATPDDALQSIVQALGTLGTPEVVPPLLAFLRLYHADAAAQGMSLALEAAMNAACELDPTATMPVLEEVAHDEQSGTSLRLRAQHLLERHAALAASERRARDIEAAEARAVAAAEVEANLSASAIRASAPQSPPTLTHLTPAVVQEALAPALPAIRACMAQAEPAVDSIRLVLVVNPTGEWSAVGTTPASLQTCVGPLVRAQPMPAVTSSLRQRVTFMITR
jgi:outer membrane protein assembly factor BamB